MQFIPKAARENATPLQVRSDMGSTNRLLAKLTMLLYVASHHGHMGSRPAHDTRTESFWSEQKTMIKDHFLEQFRNLEHLRMPNTTNFFDIRSLHLVFIKATNYRIEEMMTCHNNNPMSSEYNKSPLQLYTISSSKHQSFQNY